MRDAAAPMTEARWTPGHDKLAECLRTVAWPPSTLAGLPDLFVRPSACPRQGNPLESGGEVIGRLQLQEVLDLEPVGAKQADPLAVRGYGTRLTGPPASRSDACRS